MNRGFDPTFTEWLEENRNILAEDFEEYKDECKLEGIPAGRFRAYAKIRYDYLYN